jgi:glycerol-3-phosphate dehydrogenase (NAD(P)+)
VSRIAILGGGSWGTALAVVLSRAKKKHDISLWVHSGDVCHAMRENRENKTYLPGVALPEALKVTNVMGEAVREAPIVVGAIPTAHARAVYSEAAAHIARSSVFVSATKGLEPATHLRMSALITNVLQRARGVDFPWRIAVLSGPSFALEAARGEPTAVVIASEDASRAAELQEEFAAPGFRLYTNDDVLGVELAGAMKNVMAIAAGACQGLGLGSNPLAALITRGLAEMMRLSVALGARAETLSGLAGLGDLVLTCTGKLSRNRQVGIELGKGRPLAEILAGMRMVAEGVGTTAPLLALARESQVELPITEQVDAILHAGKAPKDAIRDIMDRPLKKE